MRLKQVEISGFKSFPDKVNIDFGDGITAIVGPNGSGKSNLVDAARWVLGEQSAKTLRGGKMEDMIFGGAAGRRPVGLAEVSLVIDNADGQLPTPMQEVRVTRRLYRSGESEYLLGGRPVRLRDVYELFMNTGIGRDGYSVIEQGSIAGVLSVRSDERRTIFEEAAGIARYRYRRNESQRRLEAAEANLVRLRDILSGYASRVEPLRLQMERARKYLVYSEERKGLEINVWLHSLEQTQDQVSKAVDDHQIATAQLADLGERQQQADLALEAQTGRVQRIHMEIDGALRAQRALAEQGAAAGSAAAVAEAELRHNAEQRQQLQHSAAQTGERLQAQQARKQALVEQLEQHRQALQVQRQQVEGLQQALRQEALQEVERQIADLRLLLFEQADHLSERRAAQSAAAAAAAAEREDGAHIGRELEAAAQQLAQREQAHAALQQALERARATAADCQNAICGRQMLQEGRKKRLEEASAELEQAGRALAERQEQHRLLVGMEQSREGFSGAAKLVLEEAAHGRLQGVHGALSSLIDTDPKYALAIETALGPALQNIVVDTEQQAKAAIGLLQRRQAGRATFLPRSAIKTGRDRPKAEGSLGIAADLVTCGAEVSDIVGSLLGRTLVAERMDDAIALARRDGHRYRVVTLDGQVINAGGSMTGGSQVKGAGLLTRRSRIEELAEAIAAQQGALEQRTRRREGLAGELALSRAELEGAQAELQTALEAAARTEAQLEGAGQAVEGLRRQHQGLLGQLGDSGAAASRLEGEAALAEADTRQLQERQRGLEAQLRQLELEQAQAAESVSQALARINERRVELAALEKETEGLAAQRQELEAAISLSGADRAQLEARQQALLQAEQAQQTQLEQHRAALLYAEQGQGEQTRLVAALTAEREQAERMQVALRQQSRELSDQKELLAAEQARTEARRQQIEAERESLTAQLFDEYELTVSQAQALRTPMANKADALRRIQTLKAAIRQLGPVNVGAVDEYREVKQQFDFYTGQIEDLETGKRELERIIGDLTREMKQIFADQFAVINAHFGRVFGDLFGGGMATLTLSDPNDVLGSGIDIHVRPEGKVINQLSALSGGEQALTAIALYFAILEVRPSPFVILDEIDTALDEINVQRLANYYKRFSGRVQLILVTHRRGTMEACDILYGVTMQERGVSKLLKIDVNDLEKEIGLTAK